MSLIEITRDQQNNPLDVVERMAAGNNWPFERAGEDEIAIVDTPPGSERLTSVALKLADVVGIPTRGGGIEPVRVVATRSFELGFRLRESLREGHA